MDFNKDCSMGLTVLVMFMVIFMAPVAVSDDMTPSSLVFDDASYTSEVEKSHQKLHALYGEALNKNLSLGKREKAKREFFKVSQVLNKKMHSRVMGLNVKEGAALSHTDVLVATHLLLMTADMLTTLQQEVWEDDPGLR